MNRTFFLKATAVATLSFAAIAATATGAQAQDRLQLAGGVTFGDQPGNAANLLLDFINNNAVVGLPNTGVFTSLAPFTTSGTLQDIVVNASGLVSTTNPFLTIGGYSFTLTNTEQAVPSNTSFVFGPIKVDQTSPNSVSASFDIAGTVTGGMYGSEVRTFSGIFSSQFDNTTVTALVGQIQGGARLSNSFSATLTVNAAQSVIPEPSTYALLATGISALGLVARRRRNQA